MRFSITESAERVRERAERASDDDYQASVADRQRPPEKRREVKKMAKSKFPKKEFPWILVDYKHKKVLGYFKTQHSALSTYASMPDEFHWPRYSGGIYAKKRRKL